MQPMRDNKTSVPATEGDDNTQIGAFDALTYIFEVSREMAALAEHHKLSRLAAGLELTRSLAAEALALSAIQSRSGKAAPDEAT